MQTDKFLSLVRRLVGKNLVTEVDSPSDFSMSTDGGASASTGNTSTVNTSTTSTSSSTDTNVSDDSTVDLGLGSDSVGDTGGAGLSSTYDIDVDTDGEEPENQTPNVSAPRYKVLDVVFDDDDDLNTKVKIQNLDTGEVEIKNLDEITL